MVEELLCTYEFNHVSSCTVTTKGEKNDVWAIRMFDEIFMNLQCILLQIKI